MTPRRPLLMLVTEPHPRLAEIVAAAVAGGVDIVQWRESPPPSLLPYRKEGPEKDGPPFRTSSSPSGTGGAGGGLFPTLRAAVTLPARLVVNAGSVETLPEDVDGLHLPEHGDSVVGARRLYGESILIGRSVHGIESALQTEADGADYVIAGTIFASNSHPGETPAGLDFLRAICAAVRIPVIAIGGITPDNAPDCLDAGASGVAVLSPIMRADDPGRAAEAYRRALDSSWKGNGS